MAGISVINLVADKPVQDFTFSFNHKIDTLIPDPERWLLAEYSVFPLDSLPGNPLDLYPNPAINSILINLHESYTEKNGSVSIYDETGRRVIFLQNLDSPLITINLQNIAKGVYVLRYKSDSHILQEKFIKIK